MQTISVSVRLVFAAALLCGIGLALFWSISQLTNEMAGAVVTGGLALVGVFAAKALERTQILKAQHRAEQLPIYQEFVNFLFLVFKNDQPDGLPWKESELKRLLVDFASQLILYGSDDVIQKFASWRIASVKSSSEQLDLSSMFNAFADLLLAIRKDLGHSNTGLEKADMFWMFMNDPELFLTASPHQLAAAIEAEKGVN